MIEMNSSTVSCKLHLHHDIYSKPLCWKETTTSLLKQLQKLMSLHSLESLMKQEECITYKWPLMDLLQVRNNTVD